MVAVPTGCAAGGREARRQEGGSRSRVGAPPGSARAAGAVGLWPCAAVVSVVGGRGRRLCWRLGENGCGCSQRVQQNSYSYDYIVTVSRIKSALPSSVGSLLYFLSPPRTAE